MKAIGYLSLGYPTLARSLEMADAYFEAGCDAVEIGIPSPNPKYEKETIRSWMQQAYAEESNYEVYFSAVTEIKTRHPDKEIYTMVYQEVMDMVSPERYGRFCLDAGVDCIISANLSKESVAAFDEMGVARCSFGSLVLDPERLEACKGPGGLIYCQAKFWPTMTPVPGYDTLEKVIAYMRSIGITRPIYCGGGIQTPDDARMVMQAGADGFFVGTAIISLADDLEELKRVIRTYCEAVSD
ncbi:MAG: tryptophan synthase subunit alpha [Faecousia sp.]